LVVEGAGGDFSRGRVALGANGGQGEAVDLVVGAGERDRVEPIRLHPYDIGGVFRKQRLEGSLVALCRQPVCQNGDAGSGQLAKRLGDTSIDGGPVGGDRAWFCGTQSV